MCGGLAAWRSLDRGFQKIARGIKDNAKPEAAQKGVKSLQPQPLDQA
jgi:hypothetical protein